MLKKIISLLLLLTMMAGVLACAKRDENGSVTGTGETDAGTQPEQTDDGRLDDLPELNYQGASFRILYPQDDIGEFFIESEPSEVVDEAVYRVNMKVRDRLGIEYEVTAVPGIDAVADRATYDNLVKGSYHSGEDAWDVVGEMIFGMPAMVREGVFSDMSKNEYLDFSKEYWNQTIVADASIDNKVYFAAGDASLSLLKKTICLLCNNELARQNNLPDLQQMAIDGQWTAEKLREYAINAYSGPNPSKPDVMSDTFGLGFQNFNHIDALVPASGISILTKNEDGGFTFTYGSSRAVDAVAFWCSLFNDNPGFITNDGPSALEGLGQDAMSAVISSAFADGRMLFVTAEFENITDIYTESVGDFTILPYPKWVEEEDYATFARNTYVSFGIMRTSPNFTMAGAVLECIASESHYTIFPAYYESALKIKYSDATPETKQVLDIIRASVKMDMGFIFSVTLGTTLLWDYAIDRNNPAWATTIASYEWSAQSAIAQYTYEVQKLEGNDG